MNHIASAVCIEAMRREQHGQPHLTVEQLGRPDVNIGLETLHIFGLKAHVPGSLQHDGIHDGVVVDYKVLTDDVEHSQQVHVLLTCQAVKVFNHRAVPLVFVVDLAVRHQPPYGMNKALVLLYLLKARHVGGNTQYDRLEHIKPILAWLATSTTARVERISRVQWVQQWSAKTVA